MTVLLSLEARDILAEEKKKTGESYAVIVEKALQTLKRNGYRAPVLRPLPKREEMVAHATEVSRGSGRERKKPATTRTGILIDDLTNETLPERTGENDNGGARQAVLGINQDEGLITRLLRFSAGPFSRKKKWFR